MVGACVSFRILEKQKKTIMKEPINKDEVLRLLRKFAIVILLLQLFTQFAFPHIFNFYLADLLWYDSFNDRENFRAVITAGFFLFCNLIIALIVFYDLDRRKSLSWILIALTLVAPWLSVIFVLAWKTVEMKQSA
jgi:hypothetical protein